MASVRTSILIDWLVRSLAPSLVGVRCKVKVASQKVSEGGKIEDSQPTNQPTTEIIEIIDKTEKKEDDLTRSHWEEEERENLK